MHKPVLLNEAVAALDIKPKGIYVDATFGGGGHFTAILQALKQGTLVGIDQDRSVLMHFMEKTLQSKSVLVKSENDHTWRFTWQGVDCFLVCDNFQQFQKTVKALGINKIQGALFDLGVSSFQLDTSERGFSFNHDGPLDMRMSQDLTVTAADLVNGLTKEELNVLFTQLGQERSARFVADACVNARRVRPILRTRELALLVIWAKSGKPGRDFWSWFAKQTDQQDKRYGRKHPATKVFQALRMAVNDEQNTLRAGLAGAINLLAPFGRLAVISFQSLEDRIVKQMFKNDATLTMINKHIITPTDLEIQENHRSRSARLRIAEKSI